MEEDLARSGNILILKGITSISNNFLPWLEDSPDLIADGLQRYQEVIGEIIWAVDIRCLYILLEMSLLLGYLVMTQAEHLEQEFHIFEYLKAHLKRKLVFDPAHPAINKNRFHKFE